MKTKIMILTALTFALTACVTLVSIHTPININGMFQTASGLPVETPLYVGAQLCMKTADNLVQCEYFSSDVNGRFEIVTQLKKSYNTQNPNVNDTIRIEDPTLTLYIPRKGAGELSTTLLVSNIKTDQNTDIDSRYKQIPCQIVSYRDAGHTTEIGLKIVANFKPQKVYQNVNYIDNYNTPVIKQQQDVINNVNVNVLK